ncbi:hypothetical protein L228DRAFT_269334 [Xylona heveae TC161]|uniref:YggU-like protein n=1 Tax=Xylona heveae (strain CBS 132557 / TC161) TaxID=1328760 RepID=A0A165G8W6_XYLHT|nr:hypothetical protein L228DRAFT_269334 [Xylona heveae TC161]KZF21885.1 hypothetical protein L228DRAFT_269334 [Xylona heveae TC161]
MSAIRPILSSLRNLSKASHSSHSAQSKSKSKSSPSKPAPLPSTISIHLHCRIKTNVPAPYAGVTSVASDAIGLSVAAQPRDGQANIAVREVISEALAIPKSNISIPQSSLKSRDKTVVLEDISIPSSTVSRVCAAGSGSGSGPGSGSEGPDKDKDKDVENVIQDIRTRLVAAIVSK